MAQKMGHIPSSKCGEVLLMKKMGILPSQAPPSSAARCSFDSLFEGNLSNSDAEALDVMFLAITNEAGRASRCPADWAISRGS